MGTEWRFRVAPTGEAVRPLVPDIAFVTANRLRGLAGRELEVPQLSPDVAAEILSPDDKRVDVDDKIATFLAAGSALVMIVDPLTRTVELHDVSTTQILGEPDILTHPALPGFSLSIAELFEGLTPPQ